MSQGCEEKECYELKVFLQLTFCSRNQIDGFTVASACFAYYLDNLHELR